MIRHLRVTALAATLLSLALLTGCAGLGASGAADDADPTSSATTPTNADTNGGTTAAWTKKGLKDTVPAPSSVPGATGYAPDGKPRLTKHLPASSNSRKCKAESAAAESARGHFRIVSASYRGAGSSFAFGIAVFAWPSARDATAAREAVEKAELCGGNESGVRTTRHGVQVTEYASPGGDASNWRVAQFWVRSTASAVYCNSTRTPVHKLCDQAVDAMVKKAAATEPH